MAANPAKGFSAPVNFNGTVSDDPVLTGPEVRGYVEEALDVRARRALQIIGSWWTEPGDLSDGHWLSSDEIGRVRSNVSSLDARSDALIRQPIPDYSANGALPPKPGSRSRGRPRK